MSIDNKLLYLNETKALQKAYLESKDKAPTEVMRDYLPLFQSVVNEATGGGFITGTKSIGDNNISLLVNKEWEKIVRKNVKTKTSKYYWTGGTSGSWSDLYFFDGGEYKFINENLKFVFKNGTTEGPFGTINFRTIENLKAGEGGAKIMDTSNNIWLEVRTDFEYNEYQVLDTPLAAGAFQVVLRYYDPSLPNGAESQSAVEDYLTSLGLDQDGNGNSFIDVYAVSDTTNSNLLFSFGYEFDNVLDTVQFYKDVDYEEGYYINRIGTYWGNDGVNYYISDVALDDISYRTNGAVQNGADAWLPQADSISRETTIRNFDNSAFAKLIIHNNAIWSNDEYEFSDLDGGDGFSSTSGSCIILWTGGGTVFEGEYTPAPFSYSELFDFYIEERKNAPNAVKYEMSLPKDIDINKTIESVETTITCGAYTNKGYLLGLPKADDAAMIDNDFYFVAKLVKTVGSNQTINIPLERKEHSEIVYWQGTAQLDTNRYVYIRLVDNYLFNGFSLEAKTGASTAMVFVLDTDNLTDTNLSNLSANAQTYQGTGNVAGSFISIDMPSLNNQIKLGTKEITENGTYAASADGLTGFSQVTVNVAGGGSGWQPDPLWTDIRDLYDNDPLAGTYAYRAIYLIAAADTSTTLPSGYRCITSDGYDTETVLAGNYTHTWNQEMDMIDSKGAYTRWIKVYRDTAAVTPPNFNNTPLWVKISLGTFLAGSTSASTSTRLSNCFALQCVEIESTYTDIGASAFYSCYSLEKVVIPNSVLTIGNNAFEACRSLDNVVISASVTSIGNAAFVNCTRLNSVTFQGTTTTFTSTTTFNVCRSLSVINLASGFDSDFYIDTVSPTILLSRQVINAMIAAYKDNSGGTARTLTIGATNLAKLTVDDIAVATAKNLSLA